MPGSKRIESVARALHILEMVGTSKQGLSLTEISEGLKLRKQTAHNLVKTLAGEGFLERLRSPIRYKLGPIAAGLQEPMGSWNRRVLRPAVPAAMRLARQTKATVAIGQYLAGEAIARLVVSSDGTPPLSSYYWRICEYGTALLFQAYMSESELHAFRQRHPLWEHPEDHRYWGSYRMLDELLEQVRARGHLAFVKGGMFRIAAPVAVNSEPAHSIISAVRPYAEMRQGEARRCIALTQRTALELTALVTAGNSGQLGAVGDPAFS